MEGSYEELIEAVYALSQPTYFDWITLCVSMVAVVFSGLAIYFAILIPKTLANQKNRISLFEKRYEIYLLLLDLHSIFQGIHQHPQRNEMKILVDAMERFKKQQGFTDNCKFYNHIVTALNSPKYFFSFETSEERYSQFQQSVELLLMVLRGREYSEEDTVEGIFENLDYFYELVQSFDRYFYICPPKPTKK